MTSQTEAKPSGPAWGSTADKPAQEIARLLQKIERGVKRLTEFSEQDLAIATAPKEEILASDMVRLYHYAPAVEKPLPVPVLIVYALVGRYQMIDLEADRSFVRKLLGEGMDVYVVDWGLPKRAQRWLTMDDYVNGYLDECVEAICARHGVQGINLLGVCQGAVFVTCYAALHPQRVKNLILTVAPLDFHADRAKQELGAGYVNLWTRAMKREDVDHMVDSLGTIPGPLMGFMFLMMNPVMNVTKYTSELIDILDDDKKLLNFLHMETWIGDRPDNPGEVVRQWLKDLYQDNKLIRNELVLGGRQVDLRNIAMPVLNVYAEGDVIIPNACSRSDKVRFGTGDYTEFGVPGGHIGTFVGGKAQKILAPKIAEWLKARM